ncbi:NADPH:quinone oxidoreductase family protein [Rhodoplanes sp. TEM]|uniref:NADPH:quinone oxidoreductase family protein n=1 Tax=Rhodoplanes tepidamans TaxID=200616 RepID=A0ABT5J8V1_RHOTP|nr:MULTISPECIES: NADPH:quinone oxidoreductase family protein [Rhodoplanes]MDC7786044.1 NADPH:quinone oxidoreductase family protein [Rhodoplanes tepidamans]MDC7983815.1 NADPH:quinone oxidoreductase family protein [Rhodoplanes sp. TEM]MDQ0354886.1 NADPH2:quinone reductase [Rhodoplanes tepidamans]
MTSTMRAWRSLAPGLDGLAMAEVPRPEPGPREMLVRVAAAALNFADLLMADDRYQVRPERPFTMGQELAGTVVAVGEGVTIPPGARVAGKVETGAFADYAVLREDLAMRVPDDLAPEAAAALPIVTTTALVALTESTLVRPGETVLITAAAGGVGLAAIEVAKDLGARVIAAAGGADKCALVREHGADVAIDYRETPLAGAVTAATDGRGVDVLLDSVGGDGKGLLRLLAWGGRLLVTGFSGGTIPQIPANRLLLRRLSAIGVYFHPDHDAAMLARVFARLSDLAARGAVRPHVGAVFGFDGLPAALAALRDRATTGKVILRVVAEVARPPNEVLQQS